MKTEEEAIQVARAHLEKVIKKEKEDHQRKMDNMLKQKEKLDETR